MSAELREKALDAALCIVHKLEGDYIAQTVAAAAAFLQFLTGEAAPKAEGSRSASSTPPASTTADPVPPTASAVVTPVSATLNVAADATPAVVVAPTVAAAVVTAPVKYDPDKVSAKVAINRPAVIELLARYGAKKGSQVKEADYPAFFAALEKIEKAAA